MPITVREYRAGSMTPAQRTDAARAVLEVVVDRIGLPTLYGGDAYGPNIRWRTDERTLLLNHGVEGLQLSVRRTAELEQAEFARFERGVGDGPEQVSYASSLPYLWQLYRSGPGSPPEVYPAGYVTPDWERLEEALESLLRAWGEQLPAQVGDDTAAFNIVNGADNGRAVGLLCGRTEGLTVLVDDRGVPGGTPPDEMEGRGWQVPLMGWWEANFAELGWESAATAAQMAVAELRFRGARSPRELGLDDVSCADRGVLTLPGLGISG
ncbi:hypothetical protein [Streptomyces decoyicus]|nr:hypothetical protein [Streptomyces decoyicus]QZY15182.1 hypothetical protein K7C20_07890 [Streptomyces decoyicus]